MKEGLSQSSEWIFDRYPTRCFETLQQLEQGKSLDLRQRNSILADQVQTLVKQIEQRQPFAGAESMVHQAWKLPEPVLGQVVNALYRTCVTKTAPTKMGNPHPEEEALSGNPQALLPELKQVIWVYGIANWTPRRPLEDTVRIVQGELLPDTEKIRLSAGHPTPIMSVASLVSEGNLPASYFAVGHELGHRRQINVARRQHKNFYPLNYELAEAQMQWIWSKAEQFPEEYLVAAYRQYPYLIHDAEIFLSALAQQMPQGYRAAYPLEPKKLHSALRAVASLDALGYGLEEAYGTMIRYLAWDGTQYRALHKFIIKDAAKRGVKEEEIPRLIEITNKEREFQRLQRLALARQTLAQALGSI